ncbi:MAG: hypothetical protein PF441_12345 [Desulfuromusa sp.]|jgi:hypothetical protein|nr:hypothetical protein [Desulfuromusa sp.]
MLTHTLHAKWITRFFVLIYLLLSFSTANASFWCQRVESHSHLEFNPVGQCWAVCHTIDDELQQSEKVAQTGLFLSVVEEDCLDSPVYSSVITPSNRTSPLSKMTATDIDQTHLPFIPAQKSGVARFANLSLASQLPPPQAVMALRTVILLQ